MEKHLRTVGVDIHTTIDEEGVVLDQKIVKRKVMAGSKEQFFIGYISMLTAFMHISGPAIKVFAQLLISQQPGVPFAINKAIKQLIAKAIGSNENGSLSTISNALSELCANGLLYRGNDMPGLYYINPRYAYKGNTHDRDKSLRAIIELGCEDC